MIKAKWKKLVMANYVVHPQVLEKYLPFNTQFDRWNDQCYVSLVGFMFMDTSLLGIKFPFHVNFEEVNLRFYVKHLSDAGWKRGVVFIKEIIPRPLATFIARTFYKEHYETFPMKHTWKFTSDQLNVEYNWKGKEWNSFKISSEASPHEITIGSEEDFFTDQHWGFTYVNPGLTLEYEVAHPRWEYYKTLVYSIDVNFGNVYGEEFAFLSNQEPQSVFLAEGSEIRLVKSSALRPRFLT